LKTRIREILQEEEELTEIVQLVGKDSLSEDQKTVLEIARVIREDFLQQNAFSPHDYMCPLYKTTGMMKCIVTFFEAAKKCINESKGDKKITWGLIQNQLEKQFLELSQMKFKEPKTPKNELMQYFQNICDEIKTEIRKLMD
jgi:V-type H+-transporting ATPase subunit A